MTDWSRLFQLLITLSEKKYSRTSLLVQCLDNFRVWSLVLSCFDNWKSDSNGGRDCTSWRGRLDPPGFVFLPAYSGGESFFINLCLWIQESSWQIFAESSLWAVCPWYNEVTMLPYNIQHEDAPWTCTVLTWHQDLYRMFLSIMTLLHCISAKKWPTLSSANYNNFLYSKHWIFAFNIVFV